MFKHLGILNGFAKDRVCFSPVSFSLSHGPSTQTQAPFLLFILVSPHLNFGVCAHGMFQLPLQPMDVDGNPGWSQLPAHIATKGASLSAFQEKLCLVWHTKFL